jgi:FtsP/CotA-like multicopper oxidase with cupredoxin domain
LKTRLVPLAPALSPLLAVAASAQGFHEPPLAVDLNPATLRMVMGHSPPDPSGDVTFFTQAKMDAQGNMVPLPAAKMTSLEAHDVKAGETWIWEITNLTHGDHPFHTHGFPLELLEYEFQDDLNPALNFGFVPTQRRMLKDTIRIPPRLGAKGTSRTIARLRVHFDDRGREGEVEAMGEQPTFRPDGSWTSGGWLVHCHILEHAARGMLSFYEIQDASNPFSLLGRFLAGASGNASLTATGDVTPWATSPSRSSERTRARR